MPKRNDEIFAMAELIAARTGKEYLNFGEVTNYLACGKGTVKDYLTAQGVDVVHVGKQKLISVYQLAEALAANRLPINRKITARA
ncbi:MAG: hypothetical protein LBN05_08415 [Oscillospiraceae bacterium]|jgi:hypothetical protein|nr:hypothetical protein [Oscillospiraceae bacterium]